jgi:hypothetical protein
MPWGYSELLEALNKIPITKSQNPNKLQIPISKSQTKFNYQNSPPTLPVEGEGERGGGFRSFEIGVWILFGIWCLEIGVFSFAPGYWHPVGFGTPAHLQAEFAGPCGKSSQRRFRLTPVCLVSFLTIGQILNSR